MIFGKPTGFTATIALATLNGTNGFRIESNARQSSLAFSVSAAGDFNGDGFDDLLIGAPGTTPPLGPTGAGMVFVLFGRSAATPSVMRLNELDGSQMLRVEGAQNSGQAGYSVSGGGDVNGDGFSDLVIGSSGVQSPPGSVIGQIHVVFGRAAIPAAPLSLATLDGTNGFSMTGLTVSEHIGETVSLAGDSNGDGFDDIIVGAGDSSPGKVGTGSSFVIFGWRTSSGSEMQVGNSTANTLTANQGATQPDILVGGGGNDVLTSDGGPDVLLGDSGDDRLVIRSIDFRRIEGGTGFDILQVDAAGLHLDLPAIPNNRLSGIEEFDLRGTGANSLTVTPLEVRSMTGNSSSSSTANTLRGFVCSLPS